ncbi:hypothetical protein D3C77_385410 [compost metagenome]
MALGCVLLLDCLQLLGRVLAEQIFEQLIQTGTVFDRPVGGAALVEHGHRCTIGFSFLNSVAVDELAKNLMGTFFFAHDDRRAGKTDARTVGQASQQIGMQVARLRAVRLIHQYEDAVVLVQYLKHLVGFVPSLRLFNFRKILGYLRHIDCAIRVAVFLDRGEDQPWALAAG